MKGALFGIFYCALYLFVTVGASFHVLWKESKFLLLELNIIFFLNKRCRRGYYNVIMAFKSGSIRWRRN